MALAAKFGPAHFYSTKFADRHQGADKSDPSGREERPPSLRSQRLPLPWISLELRRPPSGSSSLKHYPVLQTWEDPDHIDPSTGAKGDGDPIDAIEIGAKRHRIGDVVNVGFKNSETRQIYNFCFSKTTVSSKFVET